ncbi:MAG: hypothetical protein JNK05_32040 [Myxococcales bacterium]|nr:hypothetical protein [Myxococcales bacterium]
MFEKAHTHWFSLTSGLAFVGCTALRASADPTAGRVFAMSRGRLASLGADFVALVGVALGGLALTGRLGGNARPGATAAVVVGLIGASLGGRLAATAAGGVGTGHGFGGAVVAIVLGVCSTILGALALARSHGGG